jgi:ribosomal protein S1
VAKEKESRKARKLREEKEADADDDEEVKEEKYSRVELEKGQKVDRVRVKEINYFDGCPILSMREDIVGSAALTYDSLRCGMYLNTMIEEVNTQDKYITLKINDFVKGRLYLEHMADLPLKTMPPKLVQVGKEIKVRIFHIDYKTRYMEFTKKETLLKEKTPVYQSYRDCDKGSKLVGIVVDDNEHGYVIKSFGGIKALLTFADIKDNGSQIKDLKTGSVVKAYVLFRKKDKGMALTLDKAKAKELRKETEKDKP